MRNTRLKLKADRGPGFKSVDMQSSSHHVHWQPDAALGIELMESSYHTFRALSLWLQHWCHAQCSGVVHGPVFGLLKQSHVLKVRMEACCDHGVVRADL